jgi:two-component system, OmpR family, phosphate regulon sensor histidine kinase PhoR
MSQKNSHIEAELERERLVSLIGSMADGVIAIDENLSVVLSNGAALNILDLNKTLQGSLIDKIMRPIDKNGKTISLGKIIRSLRTSFSSRDWRIAYSDGSFAAVYISIAPVRLGYGKSGKKGYVILLRDITREKSLEEERDEFISVVSHELRTPIAIAEANISNAQFLFDKAKIQNPTVEEALSQSHDQIVFLAGMMNDLATLSRAERGKLELDIESVNPADITHDLKKLYERDAADKGLKINIDTDPHLELLQTSKLYAREILQNFVTNAIKYTEKGGITIGAIQKSDGVEFFVSDTGIGISKADQEKVFDKFFRSEDFRTRQNNGTGLGLYVTMKLARLLHADINLTSELNKGSTFTVFLPNLSASDNAH